MIIRPVGLIILDLQIYFNQRNFDKIEIDLGHINKLQRSKFEARFIKNVIEENLDGISLRKVDLKSFGDEYCEYFITVVKLLDKNFKLVFCVCSDRPQTIGVITFYRLKELK
ncbi:MAG: hypothetical protein ACLGG0_08225 [Bacteriovoracia bacterium]